MRYGLILLMVLLSGCSGKPEGIEPVTNFALSPYLGTWHEVARLDHRFERGLSQVTAEYSLREDGGVRVINRGYAQQKNTWQQAEGKAYFVQDSSIGHLKVSFFGPFYGAYVIFALDKDYQWAFVAGPNRDYLWLLARSPQVSTALKQQFIQQAQTLGFDTTALIWNETTP